VEIEEGKVGAFRTGVNLGVGPRLAFWDRVLGQGRNFRSGLSFFQRAFSGEASPLR